MTYGIFIDLKGSEQLSHYSSAPNTTNLINHNTHTHTLSLTYTHSHTLSHTCAHTHTHSNTYTISLTLTHAQIVLMTAFSVLHTSVYSFFRPHRSPWLRALADISNVQIILLLLVLLLLRVDTTNIPLNGAGNTIYNTNTDYLTVQAYGTC